MLDVKSASGGPGVPLRGLVLILAIYVALDFAVLILLQRYWPHVSRDFLFLISAFEFGIVNALATILYPVLLSLSKWRVGGVDVAVAFSAAVVSKLACRLLFPQLHASVQRPIGIIAVVLLAPPMEEIFARGIFLRTLIERFPRAKWVAVTAVTGAIAALHPAFWNAFILELVLAAVYLSRRNSIGASTLSHMFMNALIFTPLG